MKNRTIIAFAGRAGCGKDTLIKMLMEINTMAGEPMTVVQMGFADPIRQIARELGFDLDRKAKEVCQRLYYFDVEDRIMSAIDNTLLLHLSADQRAMLYSRAIEVLRFKGMIEDNAVLVCSPREFMQLFGTEIGQEALGRTVWVDVFISRVLKTTKPDTTIMINDLRFMHETDIVDQVVYIDRPQAGSVAKHVSEENFDKLRKMAGPNWTIENDKTLLKLYIYALALYGELGGIDDNVA